MTTVGARPTGAAEAVRTRPLDADAAAIPRWGVRIVRSTATPCALILARPRCSAAGRTASAIRTRSQRPTAVGLWRVHAAVATISAVAARTAAASIGRAKRAGKTTVAAARTDAVAVFCTQNRHTCSNNTYGSCISIELLRRERDRCDAFRHDPCRVLLRDVGLPLWNRWSAIRRRERTVRTPDDAHARPLIVGRKRGPERYRQRLARRYGDVVAVTQIPALRVAGTAAYVGCAKRRAVGTLCGRSTTGSVRGLSEQANTGTQPALRNHAGAVAASATSASAASAISRPASLAHAVIPAQTSAATVASVSTGPAAGVVRVVRAEPSIVRTLGTTVATAIIAHADGCRGVQQYRRPAQQPTGGCRVEADRDNTDGVHARRNHKRLCSPAATDKDRFTWRGRQLHVSGESLSLDRAEDAHCADPSRADMIQPPDPVCAR